MRILASVALILSTVTSPALAEDDWVDLIKGDTLDGWEIKNGKAKYENADGVIIGTSVPREPNSFLCTTEEYGDFVLEFEFFGHPNLNSGAMIRGLSNADYRDHRVHGYQCELEDEAQGRDWSGGIYDEARRGWLFPTKEDVAWGKAFGEQSRGVYKDGEWNRVRVECKGDSIKTWLNGELRADLKDGMTPKGFIGLQVHGVGNKTEPMSIKWRKIRIKEL